MYGSFKKKCEALISILNAFDLENVSSWLGKLSHPPTRLLQKKKKSPTPTHYHLRNHDNLC